MVDLAVGIQITDVAEDLRGHVACLGGSTGELDVQRHVLFGAWRELYDLTTDHEVTFHKVAGHADNELNNRCDELARAAICSLRGSASAEKPKE